MRHWLDGKITYTGEIAMRYLLAALSALLLSLPTTGTTSAQRVEPGQTFTGKVAAVTDGDT